MTNVKFYQSSSSHKNRDCSDYLKAEYRGLVTPVMEKSPTFPHFQPQLRLQTSIPQAGSSIAESSVPGREKLDMNKKNLRTVFREEHSKYLSYGSTNGGGRPKIISRVAQ